MLKVRFSRFSQRSVAARERALGTEHDGEDTLVLGHGLQQTSARNDHSHRKTMTLLPGQYLRLTSYTGFIEALKLAGRNVALPPIRPMPRIVKKAREAVHS